MAAVRRWRLLPIVFLCLWRISSAQVLYDDQVALEQYSPFIGTAFLQYPVVDEYDIPDAQIVSADPQEGDDSESYDADDRSRAVDNEEVELHKEMHVNRRTTESRQKFNAKRTKRQVAMQDDSIIQAQEKLENSIKAAKALTNIETELGTDPTIIEQKTNNLKNQLGAEMSSLEKLESQQDNPSKKSKYKHMKDVAKEDMKEAQSILSLIVKLEAAKYLAKERARQKLQQVERDRISTVPAAMASVSPQPAMPFQNPPYYPMLPSYASPYQSSSYPQYPGSYPVSSPFQGQSSWSSSQGLGMNQGNIQSVTPLPQVQMAGFGAVNPPIAAYSSEQDKLEKPEPEAQDDDVAAAVPANQNQAAGKQPVTQNGKTVTQQMATQIEKESEQPVNKPKAQNALAKVHGKNGPPIAAVAHAQGPKTQVGPRPLLMQSAPLTASSSAAKVQPNFAAASRFFDSFGTTQRLQPPVIARVSPLYSPAFMTASPAKNMHELKPAVFHTISPQSFKPALSHMTSPQSFKPAVFHTISPQSFKPAVSHITSPQSFKSAVFHTISPQSFKPVVSHTTSPQAVRPAFPPVKSPQLMKSTASFTDYASAANNMQSDMRYSPAFAKPHDVSVAYSSEQPYAEQYPSNAYYPWNMPQALPSNAPQYSWDSNAYYPQYSNGYTIPTSPPENPLLRKILRKLHDSSRASAAVSKIEQAIGLSPETVRNLIDNVKIQAKQEISKYEEDAKIERQGINAAKSRLQSKEEGSNAQKLKDKLIKEEAKLSNDEQKEQAAKLKVNEVKQIEKILTIIEAAKFSALQRAKNKLNELGAQSSEIRKRDLNDLERDLKANKRRRRNQITIWMKGSRNKVDTSHFLRSGPHKRKSQIPLDQESTLQDENLNDVMPENERIKGRHAFTVEKRTNIPEPDISIRDTLMLRMLRKMDGLFAMQTKILKELQTSHKKVHKWKWHAHAWKKHQKSVAPEAEKQKRVVS